MDNLWKKKQKYARKRSVLITTNFDGNIVITNAENPPAYQTALVFDGTQDALILTGSAEYDNSKRFNKYFCKSQKNDAATTPNDFGINPETPPQITQDDEDPNDTPEEETQDQSGTDISASAVDSDIRTTRIYNFIAEQSSDNAAVENRAEWEMVYRRAHAFKQNYVIQGFYASQDKLLWQPGKIVKVVDSFTMVNDYLLITEVTFDYNLSDGSKTNLTLLPPDAFLLKAKNKGKKKGKKSPQDYSYNIHPDSWHI